MTTQPPASALPPSAMAHLDRLRAQIRGLLIQPHDSRYDEARKVYNGMIYRHPALIIRCLAEADVSAAIDFAREHDVPLAIRGGGHSAGGLGVCNHGIVVDLSGMTSVDVDPHGRTARVAGGATLGAVDRATQAFGLATPSGIHSTTGVGGLTLGGGLGNLTRTYGLTLDNLLEATVVLADGRCVTTNSDNHPDLFWALRGGGGNFGVVTSFVFRLHAVSTVVAGAMLWPLEQATDVMAWYRDFLPVAPDQLNGRLGFITVPSIAAFPGELHGRKMCTVTWCSVGSENDMRDWLRPLRRTLPPVFDGVTSRPFLSLQKSVSDEIYPAGFQWYWKTDFVRELPNEAIERHVAFAEHMPTQHSTMQLHPIDGVAGRVSRNDTAWSHRDAHWAEVIVGVDPDPANAEVIRRWATEYWEALHPYSAGGAYMNFSMGDAESRETYYQGTYERLSHIKGRYDPSNLFHINQNIQPRM
jgi:FAD/FMN-containing dehydrogenase